MGRVKNYEFSSAMNIQGHSSLKNGNVESCMTRAVKFWKFSKPEGGICEIKFPFVFNQGF